MKTVGNGSRVIALENHNHQMAPDWIIQRCFREGSPIPDRVLRELNLPSQDHVEGRIPPIGQRLGKNKRRSADCPQPAGSPTANFPNANRGFDAAVSTNAIPATTQTNNRNARPDGIKPFQIEVTDQRRQVNRHRQSQRAAVGAIFEDWIAQGRSSGPARSPGAAAPAIREKANQLRCHGETVNAKGLGIANAVRIMPLVATIASQDLLPATARATDPPARPPGAPACSKPC